MSEFVVPLHPELSEDVLKTGGNPNVLDMNYLDALEAFRNSVSALFSEVDSDGDLYWMAFYNELGLQYPDTAGNGADLIILRMMQEVVTYTGTGEKAEMPLIRLLYSERYKVPGGEDFFTIDVTVDHENDSRCLVGGYPLIEGVRVDNCSVPLTKVTEDDQLIISLNYKLLTRIRDLDVYLDENNETEDILAGEEQDTVPILPFGHFDHPTDRQDALDKAILLLGLVSGLAPLATGDSFSLAHMDGDTASN